MKESFDVFVPIRLTNVKCVCQNKATKLPTKTCLPDIRVGLGVIFVDKICIVYKMPRNSITAKVMMISIIT